MKTQNYLRLHLPVIAISFLLIASTIGANAQNNRNEKNDNNRKQTEYKKSEKYSKKETKSWKKENDKYSEYHPKYERKYKASRDYYQHPRYGKVYQRFAYNPVVFKHDRTNYYYYGDHFYTYRRGVGYCIVEPPKHVYFDRLPAECNRVYVNGNIFFRNGNLFFQLSPRGYTIVKAPIEVRFSARF